MIEKWSNFFIDLIPFQGNIFLTLLVTILIFVLAFLFTRPFNWTIQKILEKILKKNTLQSEIFSRIEKPLKFVIIGFIWLVVIHFMPYLWKSMGGIPIFLSKSIVFIIKIFIQLFIGAGVVWVFYNLVDLCTDRMIYRLVKPDQDSNYIKYHFMPVLNRLIKVIIVSLGVLLILQNLGVNVASLIAGLGIGGIAIALAAKDSVSNVISYLNIVIDRPFSVGDWICFDDIEGTVLEVGLRSSKIKTFYDSVISVPNSQLTAVHIDNMGKRKSRRTRIYLGVEYNTPPEKIEQFTNGIKQILLKNKCIKKDYFQVHFNDFGASELKIMLNFFLFVDNWNMELKQKENIFMEILKLAGEINVQFAFPTQSIHVESFPHKEQK